MKKKADILIRGGVALTMNPQRQVITDGAVAVEGNRIAAVGCRKDVENEYEAAKVIDATDKAVLPGFVNAHNHTFDLLTRYMDLPMEGIPSNDFGQLLTRWWWPKVEDTATAEVAYAGGLLSCSEMLLRGITCTADLLEGQNLIPGGLEHVARAFVETGMRGVLSFEATERNSREKGVLGLRENADFIANWNGREDALVSGRVGVHTAFSSSPGFLKEARQLADETKAGIQIHIAQSKYEVEFIREHYGFEGSVAFLDSLGFLGPDVVAAHCIYIGDNEIDVLKKNDVKISFNIKSNGFGGNGVAPIMKFRESGLTVALGVDGINVLDMFEMMLHACYALRLRYLDASLLSGMEALEMATINGARALQLENELGSLEVGKKADVVVIDLNRIHLVPIYNIWEAVAYGARGTDVVYVLVDGKVVVDNGRLTTVKEEEVMRIAREVSKSYKERIEATPVRPEWRLPTL